MSIDTDYDVLRRVLNEYDPKGWAAEFGVYTGYSLNIISQHMPVIGFDSFEGLPEDWREGFDKGMFNDDRMLGQIPDIYTNMMLVEGWFENTVPYFPFPRLGLVHIDCDLYSSTVTALEGVLPYIGPETIVVFDEFKGYPGWEEHEAMAWEEFIAEHRIIFQTLDEGTESVAFMITAIGEPR